MSRDDLAARLGIRALELCRISSPTGEEEAIADSLESWARRHFSEREIVRRSHSLLLGDPSDPRPTVALIGHLDTVPEHPDAGPARIEGDRLFARGASDMKGAIAVVMELVERLPREELPLNLLLMLYEREEGPYLDSGLPALLQVIESPELLRLAIAMEPTDNVVQVGCVGSVHATVRVRGRSAHSARPWHGENAVHKAGALLVELADMKPKEVAVSGFHFREVMSVTKAAGGTGRNVVPDLMEMNLNYRFAPGKTLERAKADVEAFVGKRAEVEFTDMAPSGRVCTDNPLFQRLLQSTGLAAESKQAWTDVARMGELGIDGVNYGPGETTQAHQAEESASIPALALAYRKLEAFLTAE